MSMDLMLLFQGVASFSALIQAAQSALEMRGVTKDQLLQRVKKAEQDSVQSLVVSPDSVEVMLALTEDEKELIWKKIEESKNEWANTVANSNDQAVWAKATDKARSDQCALLRIAKKFGRGVLPDEWYEVWADLGCS